MSKDILGKDIWGVNVDDFQLVIRRLSLNGAITEEVKARIPKYRELLGSGFSAEIKETLEANPSGREDDNPQQDRDSQATLPRENSQGERNGENNHNKNHGDSNPGRQEEANPGRQEDDNPGGQEDDNPGGQEDDNPQQGKWKKNRKSQRENSQGERNGENNHNKNHGDSNPGRQEHDGKWKKNRGSQRENSQGERNGENNHNKKHRDSNPGRQEYDNPQQGKWKKNRVPQRENSQGERNGENNHNKNYRDSNPGRQEYDNPQQGKWKKNRVPQRENSRGERNGENNHNKKHRTLHQNVDTTVNTNSITTLGENIKQKLQRNKWYIAILLGFSLWLPVSNTLNSWEKKNPKKVTTEQKDSIKRDSESETIDKVSATGELSHFVKEGESMYSIVTNLKSSWTLSGISCVREDIIRVACEKGFIMKIKEGQTTKGKFDPRNLSPGDVIVIKIKEFENLHRQ